MPQGGRHASFIGKLGPGHIFDSKREAIATIVPQLDDAICSRCTARVFDECRQRTGAADARAQAAP